jgi:hypothetical protein
MTKITAEEYQKISDFGDQWSENLTSYLGVTDDEEAMRAVSVYMSKGEKAAIAVNSLMTRFSKHASPTRKGRLAIGSCEIAMGAMAKAFSEAVLVDTLPESGRTQEFVDLTRQLGGRKLSYLIEKSL